jgi:hypothetical protein
LTPFYIFLKVGILEGLGNKIYHVNQTNCYSTTKV